MIRKDFADVIYKTKKEKYEAVLDEIVELNQVGQPVLVGTISIDVSEDLSTRLKKRGVKHEVLNAKHHEKEAEIIAQAGQKGAVTISTNMAGSRGTDIVLGEGVPELGGLHILGTERHESRRIDTPASRTFRKAGRSGFLPVLPFIGGRSFCGFSAGERMSNIMDKLGMEEGEPIEHNLISRAIENAQSKVEAQNFDIRKHLLEYDDVMNQQREVIYRHRREALTGKNMKEAVEDMIRQKAEDIAYSFASERIPAEEWDWKGLEEAVFKQFLFRLPKLDQDAMDGLTADGLAQIVEEEAFERYKEKEEEFGEEDLRKVERHIMLQTVDSLWKDHLLSMDHLKQGIGLRGYAQQNPLVVYKKEGYEMFQGPDRQNPGRNRGHFVSNPAWCRAIPPRDLRRPKKQQDVLFQRRGEPQEEAGAEKGQKGSGETSPARAEAEKNTRSVAASEVKEGGVG